MSTRAAYTSDWVLLGVGATNAELVDSLSADALSVLAYLGDPLSDVEIAARRAALTVERSSLWTEPAPLRLAAYLRSMPAHPLLARWDRPEWMIQKLFPLEAEEAPTVDESGDYVFVQRWCDPVDLTVDRTALVEGRTPVVTTRKVYVDGRTGPISKVPTHTLYRTDGSTLTLQGAPKYYSAKAAVSAGRYRRAQHVDELVASLATPAGAGGADLLGTLTPAVEVFLASADPSALLAALDTPTTAPLRAVVADRLAYWIQP